MTLPPADAPALPIIDVSCAIILDSAGRTLQVRKRGTTAYLFPGGKPHPGEDPTTCILRELEEELGLRLSTTDLVELGTTTAPAANESGHTVRATAFLLRPGCLPEGTTPTPRAEIDDATWWPCADILAGTTAEPMAPLTRSLLRTLTSLADAGTATVYAGSRDGADPRFLATAHRLGRVLGGLGVDLLYGAGGTGMMGAVAASAAAWGGRVTGVIPEFLMRAESVRRDLDELRTVSTMDERKRYLHRGGGVILALPGGMGTLDELAEAWTLHALGQITAPVILLDRSFWTPFLHLMEHMREAEFLPDAWANSLHCADSILEVAEILAAQPPTPTDSGNSSR